MSATPTPVIGVAGVPAVASALREIGFEVVTGSTFRESAIAIATRLKSDSFHLVVESLHEPGFQKWVQMHHAKSLGVVLLPTDPSVDLGDLIADVPRLPLPATVNDLLIRLGHSPALSPAGEFVIAGLDAAAPFDGAAQTPAPSADPFPAAPVAPSDPFAAVPAPAAGSAAPVSDPFAQVPTVADPFSRAPAAAPEPVVQAPRVSDPFAQPEPVSDPLPHPEPVSEPFPQSAAVDPFQAMLDAAGATTPAPVPTPTPQPAPAPEPAAAPDAFAAMLAAAGATAPSPAEPEAPPFAPAPQPNPVAPAAPAVADPFAGSAISGDDTPDQFQQMLAQATGGAHPTVAPAPAPQPFTPAPAPQPVELPTPAPRQYATPAPAPFEPAVQQYAPAPTPHIEQPSQQYAPAPAPAPQQAAAPAPWENVRPTSTAPDADFFATDAFSAGGCQVIFSVAGKGGAGKTTQTLMYAQTAGLAGMRVLVIDANRDQGDIGSSLRIEKAGLPTVLQSIYGRPEDAVVTKAQINAVRPTASKDIEFDVVLAPPREYAGDTYASADVYSRLLSWAKQKYQLVIVDTQIVEASKSELHLGFIIPELRSGAWCAGIALYDYSAIRNAFAVFDELAALGVTPQRTLVIATRWAEQDADTDKFVSQFGHYGTFVGFVADDPNVHAQKSIGNLLVGSPAVAPAVKALLYRVTGNPVFAPDPEPTKKKRRGLFGGRK